MKIDLVSAGPEDERSCVAAALAAAGHEVIDGKDVVSQASSSVTVALVGSEKVPSDLLVRALAAAQRAGRPIVGAATVAAVDLSPEVDALPHRGEWVEIGLSAANVDDLVTTIAGHEVGTLGTNQVGAAARINRVRQVAARHRRSAGEVEGNTGPTVRVFMSYSRRDKLASDVAVALREHGYEVFEDTTSIRGGEDWRISIARGIREADVFLLVLSPSVVRSPKWIWDELGLAQSEGKRIVTVYLKPVPRLPEGFDLVVSGRQYIELFPDFKLGLGRLEEVLGETSKPDAPAGVRRGASQMVQKVRRFGHEHEVGSKAKRYGAAAAAGAAFVAAAMVKIAADEQLVSRKNYVDRTTELLKGSVQELGLVPGMTVDAYHRETRPNLMYVIGQLETIEPQDIELQRRHVQLVHRLRELLDGYDRAAKKFEDGDEAGYWRELERTTIAWSELVESTLEWLERAG